MATFSAAGIGSGLDLDGLVRQLIAAQREPAEASFANKEVVLQGKLSAYGTIKGALSSFQGTLNLLSDSSAFLATTSTSADDTVFTATSDSTATDGIYDIEVSTLARAHSLSTTTGFSEVTDAVGTGTLTFQLGSQEAKSITIASTDNSLEGIRKAVNDANIGVNASVIYDGTDYQLLFTAKEAGTNNSIKITVAEDGASPTDTDTSGLSQLAYDPAAGVGSGKNLLERSVAQDAVIKINGLQITRNSNSISDAIDGVTLNLKKEVAASETTTLTVSRSSGTVENAVNNFITSYNGYIDTVNSVTGFDTDTKQGGILTGDASVRGISGDIRGILSSSISNLDGPFKSLAEIGIVTEKDGKLTLDKSKFDAALAKGSEHIARLFAVDGSSSDALINYVSSTTSSQIGSHAINITQLATQGQLTGGTFGYSGTITLDGNNDTLSVSIDGIQSGTVTLTQGSYTGDELAAELQSKINGATTLSNAGVSATVTFDSTNKVFVFNSASYGSSSKIDISSTDSSTLSTLGLSAGAGTVGVDVEGTIGGQIATGSGRFLTGTSVTGGLKIEVLGGATGSRGTLSFERGFASRLATLVTQQLNNSASLSTRTAGVQSRIEDINDQRETLAKRLDTLESRMRREFSALDGLIAQFNATSSFLTQQLANLPKISVRNNR